MADIDILVPEEKAREQGYSLICGVDEAGRGPLAGPVYAAAVILPEHFDLPGLNDSKKLSPKKRELLDQLIREQAISFCIASASEQEIDEINILQATFLAMKRAVSGLSAVPDIALVDGNRYPGLSIKTECIVGGDAKSASIAAASILAKVARDKVMQQLHEQYPMYCFDKHKGYPTKLHYEKISEYGVSPVHRKTFLKKYFAGKAQ